MGWKRGLGICPHSSLPEQRPWSCESSSNWASVFLSPGSFLAGAGESHSRLVPESNLVVLCELSALPPGCPSGSCHLVSDHVPVTCCCFHANWILVVFMSSDTEMERRSR